MLSLVFNPASASTDIMTNDIFEKISDSLYVVNPLRGMAKSPQEHDFYAADDAAQSEDWPQAIVLGDSPRNVAATPSHINEMIASIEDNTREIYIRMREKSKMSERISASLDFLRLSKKYLSREQIESFTMFSDISEKNSRSLKHIMLEIAAIKSLDAVKKELLHTNTDLDLVYDKLGSVIELQRSALSCLRDVLRSGEGLLGLLR
ncbi:MAG: hypothetical protein FWD96_06790 [Defluviitaleaceae bacterium]|nr:hypothetical protein [Defluviitaleaceae bacterium]